MEVNNMIVNIPATRRRVLKKVRFVGPWAISKGLSPDAFRMYLNGRYVPAPGGSFEINAIKALEEDGMLVLRRSRKETKMGKSACSPL